MRRLLHYANCEDMPDPTNISKKRNVRNSHKRVYNCGGYALNTFNWYQPQDKDIDLFFNPIEEATDYMVDCMIKDFNGRLRVINDENETQEDEICIAFRIGNSDFHYAKRGNDNRWRHKMGDSNYISYMKREELYNVEGWYYGKYNGKIVFMALKK